MNMTNEEIYTKIEEIYNSEKGRGFITHLIRNFLPVHRSTFLISNENKRVMKCAITGTPLISKEELVEFQLENVDAILKNFADRILGKSEENIVVDNFEGKLFAIECEKSDKLLCLPAVQQLLNFSVSEMLKGNKHVNYIIKDERNKQFAKTNNLTSREETAVKRATTSRATMKLADIDVLKNLKNKLEKEEKK